MATYEIFFTLNSKRYFITGESSTYPTKEEYDNDTYSREIAFDSAFEIIRAYKEMNKIEGHVNRHTISFEISFDKSE